MNSKTKNSTFGVNLIHSILKNAKLILLILFVPFLLFAISGSSIPSLNALFIALAIVLGVLWVSSIVLDKVFYANWAEYRNTIAQKVGKDEPSLSGYIVLILFTLVTVLPFYIVFINSIKVPAEVNGVDFSWWPTQGAQFLSYGKVFMNDTYYITMLGSLGNTLLYSVGPTLISVFMSSMSAYAFAKLDFPAKGFLFGFILFTIMLPTGVAMGSSYLMWDNLNLTGTPWPFILPSFFGGIGTVFFLREYFMGVPDEILESAKLDGANKFGIFVRIVLPMCFPAVLAQIILCFIGGYNDYMGPLIYLDDPRTFPLQRFLSFFCNGSNVTDISILCAACILAMLPLLIIYIFLQKQILSGIVMSSGLKG